MATHRVGGEIDATCTRCKMTLAHTIIAMVGANPVRVKCNTCDGEHNYRGIAGPAAPSKARATTREAKTEKVRISFEEQISSKVGAGKAYSPKTTFLLDEVVLHPTFGRGFVEAVRGEKVDIVFATGMRTLIHGRS